MSQLKWAARYDAQTRAWILARRDRQGGLIRASRLDITCPATAVPGENGSCELQMECEVLIGGSTLDYVREPVLTVDSVWCRRLEVRNQTVKVPPVALRPRFVPPGHTKHYPMR